MPDKPPSKDKIREQLDMDVQAFLRKGGKITQHAPAVTAGKQMKYGASDVARNPSKEERNTWPNLD